VNRLLEGDDNYIYRIFQIDNLEMAGAVILSNDRNHEFFPLAFQYWRRALTLRLMDTEQVRPIYKTPLKSKNGQLSEWSTLDDLQQMEQMEQLSAQQRKVQSLLIRLRILSSIGWKAVRMHFFPAFLEFLWVELNHGGSISEILDLTWSTLDTILIRSERSHEKSVQDSIIQFVGVLYLNYFLLEKDDPKLNSKNLMKFFLALDDYVSVAHDRPRDRGSSCSS